MLAGIKDGKTIANKIRYADSFIKRLIGLLNKRKLEEEEGLLINKCKQVHTFGMKFDIDAIFLTLDGEVLHIEEDMKRNRISSYVKNSDCVLELKSGHSKKYNIKKGNIIVFKEEIK